MTRHLTAAAFILALACTLARAQEPQTPGAYIAIAWNAPTNSPVPVAGYKVYRGTEPSVYTAMWDVSTNLTKTVDLILSKTNFFAVTCYAEDGGESAFSNEISQAPVAPWPTPPQDIRFANGVEIVRGGRHVTINIVMP